MGVVASPGRVEEIKDYLIVDLEVGDPKMKHTCTGTMCGDLQILKPHPQPAPPFQFSSSFHEVSTTKNILGLIQ